MAGAFRDMSPADGYRLRLGSESMGPGFPVGGAASCVLHIGLLLMALISWQARPPILPEDVIAVDIVSDTLSVIGDNQAPETQELGVNTPSPAPMPQTTQAMLLPGPSPAAAPTDMPVVQPLPLPQSAASQTPAPREPRAPAKSAALPSAMAPPEVTPKPAPTARVVQRQTSAAAPIEFDVPAATNAASGADSGGRRPPQLASRGQAGRLGKAGGGTQLSGDLEAALRAQIQPCWLEPASLTARKDLLVVVSIDLGIDGRVLREPSVVFPASRAGASPSLIVAVDNALRAVRECAPFNLPPDRYETWRQVRFSFDPQRMTARP